MDKDNEIILIAEEAPEPKQEEVTPILTGSIKIGGTDEPTET